MIKETVKKFICENSLLEQGDSVIVGFSGGADSVCLLQLLHSISKELGITVSAAHLHHGIRGKEADRDAEFAKAFCNKFNIPFYIEYKNIPELAKNTGVSEEEAGRNARYEFFYKLKEQTGAVKIATAHNKNDNAETILHHIIRGSGTDGIVGIPVKRDCVIRPVLFLLREEIEKYCKENNLEFITDSSNLKNDYTRNKIRLELMEHLKEFNPNIVSALCLLGENVTADKEYIEKETQESVAGVVDEDSYGLFININKLKKLHPALQRRVIISTMKRANISPEHKHILMITDLLSKGVTGKTVDLPGSSAEISYEKLYFKTDIPKEEIFLYEIKNGENFINGFKIICENPDNHKIILRNRVDGDKILVNNMHKKVKKILIDKKIPLHIRNKNGVITVDGEPAAVPGIVQGDILKRFNIKINCGGFANDKRY